MTDNTETVARFVDGDTTYEIDHLGICSPNQHGECAVYRGDVQVAEFTTDAAGYRPEHRPPLPDTETLIALARTELEAS